MKRTAIVATADRENLPDVLTAGPAARRFARRSLEAWLDAPLARQEVLVGFWSEAAGNPFPDFLIVRDEELGDTHAWLSAYAGGLAPITQWCRLLGLGQTRPLLDAPEQPSLGERLGPWVGAILAECAAQARGQLNLKTLSGTLARSSASYAAARAQAVWGHYPSFMTLARRHDELSERLRARTRPVPAERLLNLWRVLAGTHWTDREPADARTLTVFADLCDHSWPEGLPAVERAGASIARVMEVFDLPDLAACGAGTQRDRVEALDRLGGRLREGPKSAAIDAVLGFGASLVEPGAAVMPELLRRFEAAMPTAQVWAGAFAGIWAPTRVLSEHQGLGRLVAKALLAGTDLFTKPQADIAFDELVRWLPTGSGDRTPIVRGMTARFLDVELMPGVAAPFQLRPEPVPSTAPTQAPAGTRQRALDLDRPESARSSGAGPSPAELAALIDALAGRVAALETKGAGTRRSARKKD